MPFSASDLDAAAWLIIQSAVEAMPRTTVITHADGYLHAEEHSRIFRFVDDLELFWAEDAGELYVRSASRLGGGDLGVNRRRVERLREVLREAGVLR